MKNGTAVFWKSVKSYHMIMENLSLPMRRTIYLLHVSSLLTALCGVLQVISLRGSQTT